jgi:hypothetical protein
MIKKVKNKNLNMFVRKNGKNHAKRKKHKVTLFMRAKSKKIKLCLDGPAK